MPGCSMKGTYATKINQDKKPQQRQAVHASWAFCCRRQTSMFDEVPSHRTSGPIICRTAQDMSNTQSKALAHFGYTSGTPKQV